MPTKRLVLWCDNPTIALSLRKVIAENELELNHVHDSQDPWTLPEEIDLLVIALTCSSTTVLLDKLNRLQKHNPGKKPATLIVLEKMIMPEETFFFLMSGVFVFIGASASRETMRYSLGALKIRQYFFDKEVTVELSEALTANPANAPRLPRFATLTTRERQVLKMLAEGNTLKQIAADLGLSWKTIDAHKFNLMRKLDIHNKAQLKQYAIEKRMI